MRKRLRTGAVAVASVGVIAGIALVGEGATADKGATAPTAAVLEDGHAFYTDAQIDDAWSFTVATFSSDLPNGVRLPRTTPKFFQIDDGKKHLFETALPAMIAAKYARCSWLREEATTTGAVKAAAAKAADLYMLNPVVRANLIGVESYDTAFTEAGADLGLTADEYELKYDCSILNEG